MKLSRPDRIVALTALVLVLEHAYRPLVRTLFRTWFFNSDEYALAAEIIRFSQLDFRQRFFDNPGTLFMLLDTPAWALFYGVQCLLGLAPKSGLTAFTFAHLPALFVLMRVTTLLFFLLSIVLLFVLTARLVNPAAAAVASLLLAMAPAYAAYSSFARTESLAMVLMLGAILWLLRGGGRAPAFVVGIFVGLAAGARLHSVTAALPPLVLLLWIGKPFGGGAYPEWIRRWSRVVLPVGWAAAGLLIVLAELRLQAAAGVRHLLVAAAAGWIAVSGMAALLHRFKRTRPLVVRVLSPDLIRLGLGCAVGGILGNPTVLWRYNYFLGSVQMYSNFIDEERLGWPFWKNVTWYVRYYLSVAAPDKLIVALLCIGTAAILIARDRKLLPFLAGAALFFVSKPIWLRASFHHIILWLPYFCIVCAYPVGKAFDWMAGRFPHGKWVASAALAGGLVLCFRFLTPGPERTLAGMQITEQRLANVQRAAAWIEDHTERDAFIAVSYFCHNPHTFYVWLARQGVHIPAGFEDGRQYLIWEGQSGALRGRSGYACVTASDRDALKYRLDLTRPGEGTDPYSDSRFRRLVSFGSEQTEVDLFRFDYR